MIGSTESGPQRRVALLERRLAQVAGISALNAEALKLRQTLGAIEMEALRIELEIGRAGATDELVRLLHEEEARADAVRFAQAECDERIADAEFEVEETDRLIAAVGDD